MYAIIATGGKQYKVPEGDIIYIEKLDNAEDIAVPCLCWAVTRWSPARRW